MRTQLLCTFAHKSNLDIVTEYIKQNFIIPEKRIFVFYCSIPENVINSFLSAEDKNFFNHPGIDAKGIVRALINKPKIILADEPTSALDDYSCDIVIDLLKDLSQENNSVLIIVTHDKRLKDKFKQFIDLDAS